MGKKKKLLVTNNVSISNTVFSKDLVCGHVKTKGLIGKEVTLSQTCPGFRCLLYKSFENTVRKGEIAHNEQFLLFPQCFLAFGELSNIIFFLEESKICRLGTG